MFPAGEGDEEGQHSEGEEEVKVIEGPVVKVADANAGRGEDKGNDAENNRKGGSEGSLHECRS
jgi:hypothetical protein